MADSIWGDRAINAVDYVIRTPGHDGHGVTESPEFPDAPLIFFRLSKRARIVEALKSNGIEILGEGTGMASPEYLVAMFVRTTNVTLLRSIADAG